MLRSLARSSILLSYDSLPTPYLPRVYHRMLLPILPLDRSTYPDMPSHASTRFRCRPCTCFGHNVITRLQPPNPCLSFVKLPCLLADRQCHPSHVTTWCKKSCIFRWMRHAANNCIEGNLAHVSLSVYTRFWPPANVLTVVRLPFFLI
jgi:hypothetical protein